MTRTDYDYAVVGLGLTGRSVLRFLASRDARVVALDTRASVPGMDALAAAHPDVAFPGGGLDVAALARAATIVLSPGVSPAEPAIAQAGAGGAELVGDIALFARHAPAPFVAITGTNGKSTVTTLVAAMLSAAGLRAPSGGNLGPPALDLLDAPAPDVYVLEVSSFQLEITRALSARVACILNLSPDHVDRHGSLEAYAQAKARVLEGARVAVLNRADPAVAALHCAAPRIEFHDGAPAARCYGVLERAGRTWLTRPDGEPLLAADELALTGRHNVTNALAALAVCEAFGVDPRAGLDALRGFSGLEHRAEVVTTAHGLTFVNDSKGTNPGAARAALEGLGKPGGVVLIAGGVSKGAAFDELAEAAARCARCVVLIGRDAPVIAAALNEAAGGPVPHVFATDMGAAVQAAARAARPGDTVLLSPACASFDMFEDYADRGRAFRAAVAAFAAS